MRSATVIVNVLKMMNAPTSSAAPANASSAGVRKPPICSLMSEAVSSAASVSGAHLKLGRNHVLDAPDEVGGCHPALSRDVDRRDLARPVEPALDILERRGHDVGPASVRGADVVGPDDRYGLDAITGRDAETVAGAEVRTSRPCHG